MNFKHFLLTSSMALLCGPIFAMSFEVDGLYYETTSDTESIVKVVKPPYGEYTGAVEFVPTVTYQGQQYSVDQSASVQVFRNSTITHFTFGEGWYDDGVKLYGIQTWLSEDYDLEKVTIKSFYDFRDGMAWIITGNGEKGVYVNVRRNPDESTEVELVNFNVYGPDGQKLEPFLVVEDSNMSAGNPTRIYPDQNGVFHLGKDFRTKDGDYCQVLPLGSGTIVTILYVEYRGKYMGLRTQPLQYQTGRYTQANGLNLALQNDHFGVMPPKYKQELYSGDVVIPSEAEYDGKTYPVKVLTSTAFEYCPDLTSLSIPAGVDSLCAYAVSSCPSLTDVYVYSKTPPRCAIGAFGYAANVEATLHVPYGSSAKYRNESEWGRFASIIEDVLIDAYIFEADGLRYEIIDDNPESLKVRVIKPAEGEYTGAVEFVPTVTYQGQQYSVDQSASLQVFRNSTITHFTFGEGWYDDGVKLYGIQTMLNEDYELEKVTIKSFYDFRDGMAWIITGNGEKGVYVNVRRNPDESTEVELVNFNVYGPDGQKLEPFLVVEDSNMSAGNPTRIYPDQNGVFHLGKDFRTKDGDYCQVLPLGSGTIVTILYVGYRGKYMGLRTQPLQYQTGRYTQANGLNLALQNDHFGVMPPKHNQELYSGDVVIPSEAEYDGKTYPVKVLTSMAFEYCPDLTSLSIPASVDSLCTYSVMSCPSLTDVNVYSKTPPRCNSAAFGHAANVEATLHVPYGSSAKYRNESEWGKFASIIEDVLIDAYIFEADGLRYEIIDDNPESLKVRVIKPAEGEYTGAVEFVPTVTYQGQQYSVDQSASVQVFRNSTITHFTFGEGWFDDGVKLYGIQTWLSEDYELEKVTIKSFYDFRDGMAWIITGNGEKGVYVNVRRNPDESTEVELVNFNVYGPDGQKLEPFLVVEDSNMSTGNPTRIYPDQNGVFHLGKDFRTKDGDYCQVLPLGSGTIVTILYVEYEGKYMGLRAQPYAHQTGRYTEANGVKFALENDHLVVMSPQHGDVLYRGDVVIPSQAEYEGRTYPVKIIGYSAFDACVDVTSITIPETVESLCTYAVNIKGGLTNIYSKSTTPPACADFAFYPSKVEINATLHVPAGTKDAYANAPEWSRFVNIIDDIDKQGIALSHSEINIAADEVFQLGYALAEGKVSWSTSDRNVAYANECGLVVAMGITGTATITATANGSSADCVVNVTSLARGLRSRDLPEGKDDSIEPINIIIESIGGIPPMVNARLIPVGSSTVMTWTSSDESVMTVENGLVTIVGDGKATLGVETENGLSQSTDTSSEDVEIAGVEDIIVDQPAKVTDNNVYDLTGRCVLRNADSEALGQLRPGYYIYAGRKLVVK